MSKKFLAIIALVVASLFVFTACGGENYDFEALKDTPAATAEVNGNGGIYVEKGDYSYFVNAAEDGTDTNTFGTYHKGRIVRCKTADLLKADRVVETVVPKIIYAEDADSSGFYIYGDKIYYTTPNMSKDSGGTVQIQKMDFMMANLDGTGTRLIATIDDNTKPYRFIEDADKDVYILYVGTSTKKVNEAETTVDAIYQISTEDGEQTLVAEDVSSYAFDEYANSKSVAFTQNVYKTDINGDEVVDSRYNVLKQFFAGEDEAVTVVNGKDEEDLRFETLTAVALKNDVVYFNSTRAITAGKTFCKASGTNVTVLANNNYTSILVAEGSEDAIYLQKDGGIYKVTFKDGAVKSNQKLCTEDGTIKLEYEDAANNRLYYSYVENYYVMSVATDKGVTTAEQSMFGLMQGTLWASYDFATIDGKTAVLCFQDGEGIKFINYLYASIIDVDAEGKLSYETKRLGLLSDANKKYAVEEGDDAFAVEDYSAQN